MADIHPTLLRDCLLIGHFSLCRLLLMRDANYPWCILVPDRPDVSEIHALNAADQYILMDESVALSRAMMTAFQPHKLNIAALGNMVPQLHIHHIARYRSDPAWPAPVWGKLPPRAYTAAELDTTLSALRAALPQAFRFD